MGAMLSDPIAKQIKSSRHGALLRRPQKSPALGRAQGATRRERDASRCAIGKFITDRTYARVNRMFRLCYRLFRYQLKRGPTNHWVSLSANLTSPVMPQFGLNFTCAPRRP